MHPGHTPFSQRRGSICAASIFPDQATCLFLLPYASRTRFALDQTVDNFLCARHVRRSDARQSRTIGRKCALTTATDHPTSTGQATNLSEDGSASFGAPCQDGPNLETGSVPCPARDAPTLAPWAFPPVLEAQIEGTCEKAEALARDDQLDQGDGRKQSALGSGAHSWWASQARYSGE